MDDVLDGAGGKDHLRGVGGNDLLTGGPGGDILDGGEGDDTVSFAGSTRGVVADLVAGTATGPGLGNDTLISIENIIGTAGADDLSGTDGDNRIDGGLGADRMAGRLGNDTYVVDDAGDVVVEAPGAGTDTVETTLAAYKLGNDVENLVYVGTGNFIGTGSVGVNLLVGGDGDDTLNGGFRHDTLRGGLGNDTYIVDEDTVEEAADAGYDTVEATYDIVLGDNLEALLFRGTRANVGTGNALDNVMTDNGAAGELNGEAGNDQLFGRAGNDIMRAGTGNDLLDGGTGDDFMRGSEGDDTYIVDTLGDVVTEAHGDGYDTVRSAVSFTLSGGFEELIITTRSAANGTGNNLENYIQGGGGANVLQGLTGDDHLVGGSGNDTLDGGTGIDWMTGGAGNDSYVVDNASDVVDEGSFAGGPVSGSGNDTVQTTLQAYSLSAVYGSASGTPGTSTNDIENLVLLGTRNSTATGNALNNHLTGNVGNNTLTGLGGADTLTGGVGRDTFVFGAGFGKDTITDFEADDVIRFQDGLFAGFADIMAHAVQSDTAVVITWSAGNKLTLADTLLGDLQSDDFLFA
ncbi:calcium-binding protein [Oleomonas cavernae]|uniref:Calcium-binding protein n=1 Tax=Oleomonas cavernae TaxID=2320859 RepID=A0A418WDL1_9PROT|nr:calcium-binding protein [Oleomonas cavernae]RJF88039.1 calcium-binding protein [Oleomonas cavernae]